MKVSLHPAGVDGVSREIFFEGGAGGAWPVAPVAVGIDSPEVSMAMGLPQ